MTSYDSVTFRATLTCKIVHYRIANEKWKILKNGDSKNNITTEWWKIA